MQGRVTEDSFSGQHYPEPSRIVAIVGEYRRGIATLEIVFGDSRSITNTLRLVLADILRNRGLWKEAEDLASKIYQSCIDELGKGHNDTMVASMQLASTHPASICTSLSGPSAWVGTAKLCRLETEYRLPAIEKMGRTCQPCDRAYSPLTRDRVHKRYQQPHFRSSHH